MTPHARPQGLRMAVESPPRHRWVAASSGVGHQGGDGGSAGGHTLAERDQRVSAIISVTERMAGCGPVHMIAHRGPAV